MGIGLAVHLAWRLYIHITYRDKTVSWTTRSLSDKHERRYISSSSSTEALPSKSLLYGEDYCKHSIVVVEGPLDVWTIGEGAVATLGTNYTRKQLEKIAKYPYRTIAYDDEPAAQEQAKRMCREL